jgi:hypothetical protein
VGGAAPAAPAATLMYSLVAAMAAAAEPPLCRQVHYRADGTVRESWVKESAVGSVSAQNKGQGAASSSVSVSSRGGTSHSSASSSVDGERRSVSISRDEKGCTIIIDERPARGDKQ